MTRSMTRGMTRSMTVCLWLGSAAPTRSIRWLDGAIAIAAKFPGAVAVAAGEPTWLDLAADRASRAGIASAGVKTELSLDYLGWAQIAAAAANHLHADTILVDEASRPERFAEVAAIAEITDAAQLTHVVALAPDNGLIHASRIAGKSLHTVRVRGAAVIGLRIAGPAIVEYPTPTPSASMKRLELQTIGLDASVLAHRALPPQSAREPRKTVERVAEHLAAHVRPAGPARSSRGS